MVLPIWLAASGTALAGIVLVVLSGTAGTIFPGGAIDPLVIGDLLLAMSVGIGMVGGGVRSPIALVVVPIAIAIILLGAGVWGWFGPGVRI